MKNTNPADLLAGHVTRYFTNYLIGQRGCTPRTVATYRDVFKLLLTWWRDHAGIQPEKLTVADLDKTTILAWLNWLETTRGVSTSTRNHRLAVVKSFSRYLLIERPDMAGPLTMIIGIRQKKHPEPDMGYLSGDETRTLLARPDPATPQGSRDQVLLATLYDSAARVQELCDLNVSDIRDAGPMVLVLHGKGGKTRRVPVMEPTAALIRNHLARQPPHPGLPPDTTPLFTGARGNRLTRWGVSNILNRNVTKIRQDTPGYAAGVTITPHTLRRSKAMHLVQAGVNLIYIRDLLGHVDVSTTEIYARADAETKRHALEQAYQPLTPGPMPDWTDDTGLITWLSQLARPGYGV